ncbi:MULTISPECIES: IS66 family transposase [Clostridium]|uniref:IS66 family transposase n=1 Tax=Clostridium TaxID=1485 RepID=UPI0013E98321|nr:MULTISPECIES: IS66 family transposase [Clostridium]MBW9159327.1 IS66 family transposase [Clostridium tagluense]MBZ9633210.1 IS66 family transposase [Clostridium sp. FP1]MBZ9634620.1 IS66 family transposase [Clostridium sp. FP1]MBZ9635118.1 IS66 family transposase [Clostridium sp. FP1]MBZ9637447.1 IS66 family transposase [Clostridium sp. FP1]
MNDLNIEEQLDYKTKNIISKMEKEIELKDKEIRELKNELSFLKNQVLNKNKKIFGKSSEQMDSNQISLFDEAEKFCDSKVAEPTIEEITYKRKKASSYVGKKDNLANLERVIIEHKLDEDKANCDKCNGQFVVIGSKSKEILKYKPAELYIEEHVTYSYACKSCEEAEGKANIITTKAPNSLLYKSMASNELISHVINLKYQYALPLYRQETYFDMLGANLSRQTLSNWIIGAAKEFEPVYDMMKEELLKSHYIQADETTVVVVDSKGEDSKAKKYMWLYKTGEYKDPIILYDYQKTRSSSCPKGFLKGFSGIIQTDGYAGYNSVENVKRLYCLAHIRRKYFDIVTKLDKEALKNSRAVIGFNFCEQLYKIEKDLRENYAGEDDYYEKRYETRLEKSTPIIEEFIKYVDIEINSALPRSPLGAALEYSRKLLPSFRIFLTDGSLEIDNNASERSIKPFVIGRKNWLMCNTPKGARASATIYSVVETAKANGLVVEKYLVYLMDVLCNLENKDNNTLLKYMPWSKELPETVKLQNRNLHGKKD